MKILRFRTKEKVYGRFDPDTGNIYIREDMKGTDYIETVVHELVHWVIWKIIPRRIQYFCHCVFDMFDGFINTFDLNLVREYYRYYMRRN